ncbi:hypothetical protein A1Q2_05913 [Trichosporon asahii var. asahii CBS 8904]|uniref:DUF866-domain-containing protein n=1 Tax=Trichosporon asahii var. asahii (strain CBS 8904) TaxID=1220162 RepID=K1VSX5_TRIAC|nr:hypothetical protein A1Q2_05913 [Trichosporon asahii var. asahii CBS 8904]
MVKLIVEIAMELENLASVKPAPDYEYFFNVTCTSCREEHPKVVSFNQQDEHELSGSRGSANFVWRCGNCKSCSFTPAGKDKSTAPLPYTSDSGALQPLVALDCRGLEVTKFHFRGKWVAETEGGKEMECDFDEGEDRWDDYDEDGGVPVSVSEMRSEVKRG